MVVAAADAGALAEDDREVLQPSVGEPRACHRGGGAAVAGPGIREIDPPVAGEGRIQGYVEQAALPFGVHLRHALHRIGQPAVRRDDAQPARPFGDQHPPVGQERERPGVRQSGGDAADAQRAGLGGELALRRLGRGGRRGQGQDTGQGGSRCHVEAPRAGDMKW
jgi:hypothetical protein